ncbi:portal protein [Sulfitobacter dubius]|uniref:portal protein n=1 Tax=Sulfitobacter dubius TaxID=218673 RepID=UPI003C6F1095
MSPILMPHRLIGRSIFDLTKDLQVIKSTLMRQYLDSTYLSVMPRVVAVEGQVNLDDLLDGTAGSIIRTRTPGAVQPLSTGGIGGEIQPLMRYIDEIKESRTGMSKASAGLDANALQSSTASAVAATVKGAGQKLEAYARTIAETGMKDLFKIVLKIVSIYQQAPRIVRLRNEFVPIDPREFEGFDIVVNVGLGTMDDQEKMARLMEIIVKQEQILQTLGPDNPLVGVDQYANTLRQYVELAGLKDASRYFKAPGAVPQQPQAAPQQQQPNPELVKIQQDYELKKAKMEAEIALDREKMLLDLELRREELAAEAQLRAAKVVADAEISTNLPRA